MDLDENYVPSAWREWVSIVPIGGFETSWEDYITFQADLKSQQSMVVYLT
jgi:hypothetical protein